MVRDRLRQVKKTLVVLSGKGGVGKSVISATTAALLSRTGKSVGIMDADVYGPSSGLILNAKGRPHEGRDGLIPPKKSGVKVMSVDLFAQGKPVPLAGKSASEIILEMMALTHWGPLDFLVIDMPPATSDIMMTVMSLEDGAPQALVVTTPERLSIAVARRTLELLKDSNVDVLGVLGNMYRPGGQLSLAGPENMARTYQVPFLGGLPFDTAVTKAIDKNDVSLLLASEFAKELRTIVKTTLL